MRTLAKACLTGLGTAALIASASATPSLPSAGDTVAIHAGTIHVVEGPSIEDGVIVVTDGRIVAVGRKGEVAVPAGASEHDFGPDAVIVPGLVAADSYYGSSTPSERTADPTLLAIDTFDPYSNLMSAVRSGITSVYLAPARGRLIAGQGAVVKSGGGDQGDPDARVLSDAAGLHGSISQEARSTPGYWQPPVPATVDVGLGQELPQLPRTTMGAVLAFEELMALAGGDASLEAEYGKHAGPAIAKALEGNTTWRLGAENPEEVRAVLDVAERFGFPLVIQGASSAASMAEAIAEAGVPVVASPHFNAASNTGKSETSNWPSYDTIARLVGEGVTVAIVAPQRLGSSELRFAAALAMRGGLSEAAALRAITLDAAKILGVDNRVGSLTVGKDADIVVMTGAPMSLGASVAATFIGGELVWSPEMEAEARAETYRKESRTGRAPKINPPIVVQVDELHVGNGEVIAPGELLVRNGKIAEVGRKVGRPSGSRVVQGAAAMPGMIDAYGHLGTEGGRRPFSTRFDTRRILEPGDYADRQVAKGGVTTVNMISRSTGNLTPSIAYKPAADDFGRLVVDDVATVVMQWDASIVTQSGNAVRSTLEKAKKYVAAWEKYEQDIAKWTPPAEEPESDDEDEEKDEEDDEKGDDDKKKKSKKERDPAKPVTGVFEGQATGWDGTVYSLRYRFHEDESGAITGSARLSLYDELMPLTGQRDEYDVTLEVETPNGLANVTLAQIYSNDPPPKGSKKKKKDKDEDDDDKKDDDEEGDSDEVKTYLRGSVKIGDEEVATVDVTQVSSEYKVAKRTVRAPEKEEKTREPRGKPKKPSIDPDLEPLRRAMTGQAAVLVTVNRRDQVLDCVAAFADAGIKPVLLDSSEAHLVASQISGRVRGAIFDQNRMASTFNGSTTNRAAILSSAGVPVAFGSKAEEGAVELGVIAARGVARGLSPVAALRGLTADAAKILAIENRVGTLAVGKDADILVLDGSPLEVSSSVERVFVNGREVR